MLPRLVTAAAVLAVLVGCSPAAQAVDGTATAEGSVMTNTIQVGDLSRSYIVRAPDDATQPMPLLIMFHGAGGDGSRAETATGLTELAEIEGFVVAYPNGTPANAVAGELAWNAGGCCGLARSDNVDDVAFVLAMIAELQAEYPINASRIYLAGYSNGGMMSYRLACEHSDLFAGVAVISGALNYSPCDPASALSVLIVHGTGDLTVPYDGGGTNTRTAARFGQWNNSSVEFATAFWTENDDCDRDAVATGNPPITTEVYPDCADETRVEVVTIEDGTHTWPRADTLGVDGAQLLLDFFDL